MYIVIALVSIGLHGNASYFNIVRNENVHDYSHKSSKASDKIVLENSYTKSLSQC